jgi:hypothetical protein
VGQAFDVEGRRVAFSFQIRVHGTAIFLLIIMMLVRDLSMMMRLPVLAWIRISILVQMGIRGGKRRVKHNALF